MNNDLERAKNHFEQALNALGNENFFLAECELRQACQLAPDRPSILTNLSAVLVHQQKWTEAIHFCRQLLKIEPNNLEGLINLGVCKLHTNDPDSALIQFNRAIEIDPLSPLGWVNKANVLLEQELFSEARACFDRSLALDPKSEESLIGLGNLHNEQKEYGTALEYFSSVLEINPNNAQAQWNKALSLLRLGSFDKGWRLYEARWNIAGMREHAKHQNIPLWLGNTSLIGKTILIHAEQGFGDAIQMSRYLPMLENEMGAKVIFEVPSPLLELMQSLSPTIELLNSGGTHNQKITKHIDFQCPVMSLPLAFKTELESIPNKTPYLFADIKRRLIWRQRLAELSAAKDPRSGKPLRIGIAWAGSGHYAGKKNLKRDLPYEDVIALIQFFQSESIEFHALQVGTQNHWLATKPKNLFFHQGLLNDFAESAALIVELDLIVSIDTAVGHLAGALGRKTCLLLPDPPDFMSMIDTNKSPWYPSSQFIRQVQCGIWPLDLIANTILAKLGP